MVVHLTNQRCQLVPVLLCCTLAAMLISSARAQADGEAPKVPQGEDNSFVVNQLPFMGQLLGNKRLMMGTSLLEVKDWLEQSGAKRVDEKPNLYELTPEGAVGRDVHSIRLRFDDQSLRWCKVIYQTAPVGSQPIRFFEDKLDRQFGARVGMVQDSQGEKHPVWLKGNDAAVATHAEVVCWYMVEVSNSKKMADSLRQQIQMAAGGEQVTANHLNLFKQLTDAYDAAANANSRILEIGRLARKRPDELRELLKYFAKQTPTDPRLREVRATSTFGRCLLIASYFADQTRGTSELASEFRDLRKLWRGIDKPIETGATEFVEFQMRLNDLVLSGAREVPQAFVKNNMYQCNCFLASLFRQSMIQAWTGDGPNDRKPLPDVSMTETQAELLLSLVRQYERAGGVRELVAEVEQTLVTQLCASRAYLALKRDGATGTGSVVALIVPDSQAAGKVKVGDIITEYARVPVQSKKHLIELISSHAGDKEPIAASVLDPATNRVRTAMFNPGKLGLGLIDPSSAIRLSGPSGGIPALIVVCNVVDELKEYLQSGLVRYQVQKLLPGKPNVERERAQLSSTAAAFARLVEDPFLTTFEARLNNTAMTPSLFWKVLPIALSVRANDHSLLRQVVLKYPEHAADAWHRLALELLSASGSENVGQFDSLRGQFVTFSEILSQVQEQPAYRQWATGLAGATQEDKAELRAGIQNLEEASLIISDPRMAQPRLSRALECFARHDAPYLEAKVHLQQAATLIETMRFDEALAQLSELEMNTAVTLLPELRLDLWHINCRLLMATGDYAKATLARKSYLGLLERLAGRQHESYARMLVQASKESLLSGDLAGAHATLLEAASCADLYGYSTCRASALTGLAEVAYRRDKFAEAKQLIQQAEASYEKLMKLSDGGAFLVTADDFKVLGGTVAEQMRVRDIELARRQTALLHALVAEAMSEDDVAWEQYRKASYLAELGDYALRTARESDAFYSFSTLVTNAIRSDETVEYDQLFDGLSGLGQTYARRTKDFPLSLWCDLAAVSIAEHCRESLVTSRLLSSSRTYFLRDKLAPYQQAIGTLIEMQQQRIELETPEMPARALAKSALRYRGTTAAIPFGRFSSNEDLLDDFEERLLRAAPVISPTTLGSNSAEVALTLAEVSRGRALFEDLSSTGRELLASSLTSDGMQSTYPILSENQLFLMFKCLSDKVVLWTIDSQRHMEMTTIDVKGPDDTDLYEQIREFRDLLSHSYAKAGRGVDFASPQHLQVVNRTQTDLATTIYERLLKPALTDVASQTHLIICADGALSGIPFEALHLSKTEGGGSNAVALLDDVFLVSYAFSIRTHNLGRNRSAPIGGHERSVLAIGDPVYTIDDSRLGTGNAIHASAWSAAISANAVKNPWRRLCGTTRELLAIEKKCNEHSVTCTPLSGTKVTEDFVKATAFGDYRCVHFATHGTVGRVVPYVEEPALVLSLYSDQQISGDGYLTMTEIMQLDLKGVELVVLSACDSSRGETIDGEGTLSLGRAFRAAGAGALVVTQWRVYDPSTTLLMEQFYDQLLSGEHPANALRKARRYLRSYDDGRYSDPYYWAPFVFIDR